MLVACRKLVSEQITSPVVRSEGFSLHGLLV